MSIKFLIVDDEPLAHKVIERFAADASGLEKVGQCYDALEAIAFLREQPVDLIFLDIHMPKLKGLDFLKILKQAPAIILTTAYKEYALEAFELEVLDYLLKPFSFERFLKAINKLNISPTPNKEAPLAHSPPSSRIFVKTDKKHIQVNLSNIQYLAAYGSYVKLYTDDRMILAHHKLSDFEQMLPAKDFIRVHKSYLLPIAKIESIEGNQVQLGDQKIPVGATYRQKVKALLK